MTDKALQTSTRGIRWGFILTVVGLAALMTAYYWVHLTETMETLSALGFLPTFVMQFPVAAAAAILRGAPDVLAVSLLALASAGVGETLLYRFVFASERHASAISITERSVMAVLLGLGLLAIGALGIGLVGLYNRIFLWGLVAAVLILTHQGLLRWLRQMALLRAALPRSPFEALVGACVAIGLLAVLLIAFAPPFTWDAMTYHLVAPARYLEDGAIRAYPDNTYLGFSQGVETLYGVVISLFGRDTAAAPLHWLYGLLALIGVAGLVRRIASRFAAWCAAGLLLSAYSLWALFGDPYVDLALLAYSACIVSALSLWLRDRWDGWLILLGIFGGLALGVKYTAGVYLAAVVWVLLLTQPRQIIRLGLLVGVPALLLFSPWLLRGWLLWGNPIYPFVFGGLAWDSLRSTALSASGAGMIAQGTVWQLALLPLSATIFGVDSITPYDFSTGPLLLTAGALLGIGWRALDQDLRGVARGCLLMLLPVIAVWMITSAMSAVGAQPRLVVMAFVPFAVLGALALYGLREHPLHRITSGALVFALVMSLLGIVGLLRSTAVFPLHLSGDRVAYIDHNLGVHVRAMGQLATLPEGSHVRVLFDPMGYYCPPEIVCSADLLFDQWGRPLRLGASADAVMEGWQADTDYVLLFNAGYAYWKASDVQYRPENALLLDTLTRWMMPVWEDEVGAYTLYTWR